MGVGYKGRCRPKQQAPLIVRLLLSAKEMTSFPLRPLFHRMLRTRFGHLNRCVKPKQLSARRLDLPNMGPGALVLNRQLHQAVVGRQATTRRRRRPARLLEHVLSDHEPVHLHRPRGPRCRSCAAINFTLTGRRDVRSTLDCPTETGTLPRDSAASVPGTSEATTNPTIACAIRRHGERADLKTTSSWVRLGRTALPNRSSTDFVTSC